MYRITLPNKTKGEGIYTHNSFDNKNATSITIIVLNITKGNNYSFAKIFFWGVGEEKNAI